ncbi:MAG: hypothetical protein ABSH38_21130 [Verrucomicrobiota bacterium]|jgi:hypothetical protein
MKSYRITAVSSTFAAFLLLVGTAPAQPAATLPMKEPRLIEEQGRDKLASYAATWHTRTEWEQRAKNIRQGKLRAGKGDCAEPRKLLIYEE